MSLRNLSIILWVFSFPGFLLAQKRANPEKEKVYKVNRLVSAGIGVAGITTDYFGIRRLVNKAEIPEEVVLGLDKNKVGKFDRIALFQDLEKRERSKRLSDIGLVTTFFAPVFLFTDEEIRSDWLDISLLYLETQVISTNMYSWGPFGPAFNNRFRPGAYYDELSLESRQNGRKRNSFYSGHVSTTATGSFFIAKVYCDYHPHLGSKKWLIYGAALIPPAFVGLHRVRSLNHFPTDTIVGTIIGGAIGILIPELHRNKYYKLSVISNNEVNGLAFSLSF